jgi:hypothetical protein
MFCPYCGDKEVVYLTDAELLATNLPKPRRVSSGKIYRCSKWHIFPVFPQNTPADDESM